MALIDSQSAAQGQAGGVTIIGNNDDRVSPYLKCWIAQPDMQNNISSCVVGLIGPGTVRSVQANWNSPFEQSNLGGMFEKVGGMLQAVSEKTSVTTLSSTQIWEGNRPHNFNLTMLFYAISDAYKEVMLPLKTLETMMGPSVSAGDSTNGIMDILKSSIPGGRIPLPVIINVGRNMVVPNCVIESMSVPLDGPRTSDGWLTKAEVTLSISTKVMLNRENIAKTWPQG